ncbi:hypothetical protein HanIR_Chr01g0010671 [Helianthus annuus]|nr:hypothetical protein HanIR_Chr01g0010671 [Helianthus annuus]
MVNDLNDVWITGGDTSLVRRAPTGFMNGSTRFSFNSSFGLFGPGTLGLGSGQTRYGPCSGSVFVSVKRVKDSQRRSTSGQLRSSQPESRDVSFG